MLLKLAMDMEKKSTALTLIFFFKLYIIVLVLPNIRGTLNIVANIETFQIKKTYLLKLKSNIYT